MVQSFASSLIGKSSSPSSANAHHQPEDVHRSYSMGAICYGSGEPNVAQPRVPPQRRRISTPWDIDEEDVEEEEEEPIYEVIKSNPPIYVDLVSDANSIQDSPDPPRPDAAVSTRSSTSSHVLEIKPKRLLPPSRVSSGPSANATSTKQPSAGANKQISIHDSSILSDDVGAPRSMRLTKEDEV